MHLIAHRGNLYGPQPASENSPDYLAAALEAGFDVETDVWLTEAGDWMLGHDGPQYHLQDPQLLKDHRVWCHAKNHAALSALLGMGAHVFSHDRDPVVCTSHGIAWAFPGQPIDHRTVCVMPEGQSYTEQQLEACKAVCSDYVGYYKQRAGCTVRIALLLIGRLTCQHEWLLPQVRRYLQDHPSHWIDIHACIAQSDEQQQQCSQEPFMASLLCANFVPDTDFEATCYQRKAPEAIVCNTLSMFHNNYQAWLLMQKYAAANGIKYDAWLKYRSDIVADQLPSIPFTISLPPDTVFIPDDHHFGQFGGCNDQIAYAACGGLAETAYFAVFKTMRDDLYGDPAYIIHPESMLRYSLNKHQVSITQFAFPYHLDPNRWQR